MERFKIIIIAVLVISASKIYPDIQGSLNNLRNSYREGNYISIVKGGSDIIDSACGEILKNFYVMLPDLPEYTVSNTNGSYNFTIGDGLSDYSITAEKTFTGKDEVATMTLSSSPFDVERYDNLIKGYEYLSDKGDYEKYSVTVRKKEYSYIIDRSSAYFTYTIETNSQSGEITSGLLFKLTFTKGVKTAEKKTAVEESINAFIGRLLGSSLLTLLK